MRCDAGHHKRRATRPVNAPNRPPGRLSRLPGASNAFDDDTHRLRAFSCREAGTGDRKGIIC